MKNLKVSCNPKSNDMIIICSEYKS